MAQPQHVGWIHHYISLMFHVKKQFLRVKILSVPDSDLTIYFLQILYSFPITKTRKTNEQINSCVTNKCDNFFVLGKVNLVKQQLQPSKYVCCFKWKYKTKAAAENSSRHIARHHQYIQFDYLDHFRTCHLKQHWYGMVTFRSTFLFLN